MTAGSPEVPNDMFSADDFWAGILSTTRQNPNFPRTQARNVEFFRLFLVPRRCGATT